MRLREILWLVILCLAAALPLAAQTINGSISGTVVDSTGAVVAQAKVTATNTAQNTSVSTETDAAGNFVFPELLPANYTLAVEKAGFKKFEQHDVVLNAFTRLTVGNLTLQVGALAQTVEVTAQAQQVNTQSAEVGKTIVGTQIQNIEVNGRTPLSLLRTVPGLYTDLNTSVGDNQTGNIYVNGSRNDQFNITLNGASNLDTGSNTKMFATVSLDSTQEFRVLTNSYDARYGKAGGAQIIQITKSGTKDFHGSGYWYYRDRGMNANSWFSNREGLAKPMYHFNDLGYTIGGPIYVPNKFNSPKDKLFFFWSEEYQSQPALPEGLRRITVPTALERKGDFSQSMNITGSIAKPIGLLKDPNSTLPCTSSNRAGCIQSGGTLGLIPSSEQFAPGLAALNLYPLPNTSGVGYNYQSQVSDSHPRHEQLLRIDSNLTEKWRLFGSWTNLPTDYLQSVYCPSGYSLCGNFPLTPYRYDHPGYVFSVDATATLSPTLTNEILFDIGHHPVSVLPADPKALTRATTGISLPTFYAPYADWIPQISFSGGNTQINNSPGLNTGGGAWTPFKTYNTTLEWIDNLSSVRGKHLLQAGIYIQRNRKPQTAFAIAGGQYNFGDPNGSPLNTGYAFANAALGVVGQFSQASNYVTGQYKYTNVEWYVQDSWKVWPRLTLNYGLRFYWQQPWYDSADQTTSFFASKWDPAQAPQLFWPGFDPATGKKAALVGSPTGPVAIDPATGKPYANPNLVIGLLVPNSGNLTNGILQAGKGISRYLMQSQGILPAPRLGLAWDITGKGNMVFHAGAGSYFDRYQGNEIFNVITNPPTIFTPNVINTMAQNIVALTGTSSPSPIGVSGLTTISYSGNVPTVYNYNAGIQSRLPWAMLLDVSYVGSLGRELLFNRNINPIPYGALWLPQNQDPTKVKASPTALLGTNAYSSQFLRSFQGYGGITLESFGANSNYNSLQARVERRFAKGLFLDVIYTWGKCLTWADNDGAGARIDNLTRLANYGPCGYDIRQIFTLDYVYNIPSPAARLGGLNNAFGRGVFNGWQLSGITTFRTGAATSVGYSFSGPVNTNNNLTGTPDAGARVKLIGNPYAGTTDSPYNRLNAAAFAPPTYPSLGLESGVNYLNTPGVNNFDLSLQKNARLTERAHLEFRIDAFNAFNHTQFGGFNNTLNYITSVSNGVITYTGPTNLFDPSNAFNTRNNFGTVSSDRGARVVQAVVRFVF